MAIFDLIFLICIGLGIFKGYKKGLLIEVLSLGAFVLSIFIGFKLLGLSSQYLQKFLGLETLKFLSPYLSFLVVFFPSLFLLKKASIMMRSAIRLTFLGSFDRILGAVLGGFTAMFLSSLLLWIVLKLGITIPETWLKETKLFAYAKSFALDIISKIMAIMPAGGNWMDKIELLKNSVVSH